MKRLSLTIMLIAFGFWGKTEAQCVLTANHDTQNEVIACLNACGCNQLVVPDGVNIDMTGSWNLVDRGPITLTIQGNGGIHMGSNGSVAEEINLASGSSVIITNTSNLNALTASGGGGQIRLRIGALSWSGNELSNLIAAGGFLPIELVDFRVSARNEVVALQWSTGSEINNERFEVERSCNGRDYEVIGSVNGAQNSNIRRDYTFTDLQPGQGTLCYRLRQIDTDGRATYGPIRQVRITGSAEIAVYPNPATDFISVEMSETIDQGQWFIADMSGKIVFRGFWPEGQSLYIIPVGQLPAGAYTVNIKTEQIAWVRQFIK